MKALKLITRALIIVGGVNWGLVGLFNLDLVAALFGAGSALTVAVYLLVGLSAIYQLVPLISATNEGRLAGHGSH